MRLTVPVETMVPISRFGRGTASSEFAKVGDGTPRHRHEEQPPHLLQPQRA